MTALGVAIGAIVLLLALDAVWVGATAAREARDVRDRLSEGADLLEAGRVEEAAIRFDLAEQAAESLRGALGHPVAIVAGMVPGLSDDVDAAEALGEASEHAARGGTALARAAADAGWDGETVPGLAAGGDIDTDSIERAQPELEIAANATERAFALLRPIDAEGLIGPLREAVVDARDELEQWAPTVRRAALVGRLLPSFLGGDAPRRYLVIAQNLSDPRGSGGHVGSHAILEADDGRLSLGRMGLTAQLSRGPEIQAPPDVTERYRQFGSLDHLMAVTYPPDFRTAAELALAQWEARDEEPVDGVISVDAVFMSYALRAVGPVETRWWPDPITADNVVDVLSRDTFLFQDQETSNRLQGALAAVLWQALLERMPEAQPFGDAISTATRERHLQVYSTDGSEQALLEELGAAGRVPATGNPLQVLWNGVIGNRTGYYAEKEVEYRAVLAPDGSAMVTILVSVHNPGPDGPPSILLGTGSPTLPVGSYRAYANLYLPMGAELVSTRGGLIDEWEQEGGRPVLEALLQADSGQTATFQLRYRAGGLVVDSGDARRFDLDVLPQPALRPDAIRVVVEVPSGAEVLSVSRGATTEAGVLRWEGAPTTPQHLWIRFAGSS